MLQPHQQRVLDEKRDLDEKLAKLSQFLCRVSGSDQSLQVPEAERRLLSQQHLHMTAYSDTLGHRLALWGVNPAQPAACPHAAPFRYCERCAVNPCPIGLGA